MMFIRVLVFDDRVEVENPGLLSFGLTVDDIQNGVSKLRNRVIGRVFRELGLIERWGGGIPRMIDTCRENGLPAPDLQEIGTHFRVTFRLQSVSRAVVDPVGSRILAAIAGVALAEALRLKQKDPVAAGNLKILEYLLRHGGTYWDYLERPLDRKQIERLADQEKWERVTDLCTNFNDCRREAFAQSTLLKGGKERSRLPDLLATLRSFFDFVSRIDASGIFLNEDIGLVHRNFKPIMHKFIFKFGDVDREMMEDVFEALQAYYGFLTSRRIVDAAEFTRFQETILKTKGELLDKMEQYNAVRHDAAVSEKKKERLREKLFEGDHLWPHI
jgi:hypothetical protein